MERQFKVGDKIYFAEEKKPYTIRACDSRYLICTKPFNLKKDTVLYTIVDLKEEIRGADNYWKWGGYRDYRTKSSCEEVLRALRKGFAGDDGVVISPRNRIGLNIVKYVHLS